MGRIGSSRFLLAISVVMSTACASTPSLTPQEHLARRRLVDSVNPRIVKHEGTEVVDVLVDGVHLDRASERVVVRFDGTISGRPTGALQTDGLVNALTASTRLAEIQSISPLFGFELRYGRLFVSAVDEPNEQRELELSETGLQNITDLGDVHELTNHVVFCVESHPITERPPRPKKRLWTISMAELEKLLNSAQALGKGGPTSRGEPPTAPPETARPEIVKHENTEVAFAQTTGTGLDRDIERLVLRFETSDGDDLQSCGYGTATPASPDLVPASAVGPTYDFELPHGKTHLQFTETGGKKRSGVLVLQEYRQPAHEALQLFETHELIDQILLVVETKCDACQPQGPKKKRLWSVDIAELEKLLEQDEGRSGARGDGRRRRD